MEYTVEKTRRRQVPSMGRLSLYSVEWVHAATSVDKRRSACVGMLLHLLGEHFMQGHISTINSFEILSALIHTLCVRGLPKKILDSCRSNILPYPQKAREKLAFLDYQSIVLKIRGTRSLDGDETGPSQNFDFVRNTLSINPEMALPAK
ncbi:hypothetical protein [Anaeromassilibacillus sp. Marseille-P3371]|uniref:hypothetical protein n=2 Tax=unclassified Anaeromassilibacillus TaxID=2625359 RepID=UPI001177F5F0|nr:hypothetical protein [Anaeromassilibacillus sp. Marseille-P3371]MBS6235726.1 hypothetical protein [Clostridiales bacterium]